MQNSKPQLKTKNFLGFTLIELLTVISIIGVLALIGIPAFRAYQPSLELSGAVRKLVGDLRYAEQLAVTEQVNHGISFSSSTNQYQMISYGAVEETLASTTLPEKVSFYQIAGFTNDQVIFNLYGAVKEAGSITLITKDATTTIEIRPSGFVKIIK